MTTPVPHDRRWQVLGVIGIAQLMVVLDVTIVNIALPSAQRDLGFSADDRQWVITAYALAFGGLLLLGGRIADLFGRKRDVHRRAARVRGRVRGRRRGDELRGARRRPRRPGRVRRAARPRRAVAADDHVHRPEGAREGVRDLRRDRRHGRRDRPAARRRADRVARLALVPVRLGRLRPAGGGDRVRGCCATCRSRTGRGSTCAARSTASTGLFALVFGLSRAETDGWGDPITIGCLAASAVLLTGFVALQRRTKQPLLPLRVVSDRDRGASFLAIATASAGLFGLFLFLTYYLQLTKGFSAFETGLAFLPMSFSIAPTVGVMTHEDPAAHRAAAARPGRDAARRASACSCSPGWTRPAPTRRTCCRR